MFLFHLYEIRDKRWFAVTTRQPSWWSRTKVFLSPKIYYHVNSTRKKSTALIPDMAALSRGCKPRIVRNFYFGGARSKEFATLRNVSKLQFFDKIGHAKSVGFRFYSAIWRSESRISSRYLEIISISLIYSLTFSRKKESFFWLSWGLNRLTCVTLQIRGDSKLRD